MRPGAAAAARDVTRRGSRLDLLRRDDGEGAEAEVEVLFHVDALADYLAELLGGEADAVEPPLKLFGEGKRLMRSVSASVDLLLGGVPCGSFSASCGTSRWSIRVEHAAQIFRARAVERRVGLKRQLPEQVRVGYQARCR